MQDKSQTLDALLVKPTLLASKRLNGRTNELGIGTFSFKDEIWLTNVPHGNQKQGHTHTIVSGIRRVSPINPLTEIPRWTQDGKKQLQKAARETCSADAQHRI